MLSLRKMCVGSAAIAFAVAGVTRAGTIEQGVGQNYVAFEAEDNAAFNNGGAIVFANVTDPGTNGAASGGRALLEQNNGNAAGSSQAAPGSSSATYTLDFQSPGTYNLYYKWRADQSPAVQTSGFQANSFYLPATFGAVPSVIASSNGVSTTSTPSDANYIITRDATTYTVAAAGPVTFTIGTREQYMYIDRFVFSQADLGALTTGGSSTADTSSFDAVPNSVPEPTSAATGLLAMAGLALRRRRA